MLDKLPKDKKSKDMGGVNPNFEKMKRKTIFALLSLVSTLGISGMNINSANASQISPQISPQNLYDNQISQFNPNLVTQNNEPKWVIQGRQNIMKFVETMKENGVIQSHLGEKVLDSGQFARVVINFEPNSADAKSEINAAIKKMISTMSESERKLVIIAYKNGTIGGLIITKFDQNMTTGIINIDIERIDQVFPGLKNQITNFRGQSY